MLCGPSTRAVQAAPAPSEPVLPAAGTATLSLDDALALALARNHALTAARHAVEASAGATLQAGARRNPQFNASVEDTQHRTQVATGTVDLPIEFGGKRSARVAAAERGADLARSELARAMAALRAAVVAAYDEVAIAQERVTLASDSAALAARSADVTARRVAAGKVSPVEDSRARVDQVNAEMELEEARAALRHARLGLAVLWGDAEPSFAMVDGVLGLAVPAARALAGAAADVAAAPDLVARRLEIAQRRALLDVERSKRYPDLNLNLGVKRDNEVGRTQAVIGFSVPLPLFDRNEGAILEADRRVAQAQDEYEDARIRLTNEVQQALGRIDASARTVQTLRSTVLPAARQLYDAANQGYAAGKFGFLEVLDAQRTLLQAQARYLAALSTARQASATLDRLLGF